MWSNFSILDSSNVSVLRCFSAENFYFHLFDSPRQKQERFFESINGLYAVLSLRRFGSAARRFSFHLEPSQRRFRRTIRRIERVLAMSIQFEFL